MVEACSIDSITAGFNVPFRRWNIHNQHVCSYLMDLEVIVQRGWLEVVHI